MVMARAPEVTPLTDRHLASSPELKALKSSNSPCGSLDRPTHIATHDAGLAHQPSCQLRCTVPGAQPRHRTLAHGGARTFTIMPFTSQTAIRSCDFRSTTSRSLCHDGAPFPPRQPTSTERALQSGVRLLTCPSLFPGHFSLRLTQPVDRLSGSAQLLPAIPAQVPPFDGPSPKPVRPLARNPALVRAVLVRDPKGIAAPARTTPVLRGFQVA